MQEQDQKKSKKFVLIESNKEYKINNEEQLIQVEEYIKHLLGRFTQERNLQSKSDAKNKLFSVQEKVLKRLGDILGKVPSRIFVQFGQHFYTILDELIQLAKQHTNFSTISLLISILSPQLKYESKQSKDSHQYETNINNNNISPQIIALPPYQQQSIIALPFSSNNSLVIVNANDSGNDVASQQYRQQSEKYFVQDDKLVQKYLQERFVTVQRQGISEIFRHAVQRIVNNFIEPIIVNQQKVINLRVDQLISSLKLIEHISPSLYTYYLLSLIKSLSQTLLQNFSIHQSKILPENNILLNQMTIRLKRTEYQEIIYLFKTLAQRWTEHKSQFNIEIWQWQMQKCMILTFIQSPVSEKQLHSIKVLIDRIRKVQYNSYSVINQVSLIEFINENHLLLKIYKPQNHPEVIIKGKQVFQFVSKDVGLGKQMIDLVFEMIAKSNQSLGKGLYQTLHAVGHQNLQLNREYILKKIQTLPRAGLFYDQTFTLIQSLILLSPLEIIRQSLEYTCKIIKVHYLGLKPQLQHKLLNIYFEVYLMGVQQGVFDGKSGQDQNMNEQDNAMVCLKPFVQNTQQRSNEELLFLMIDKFIQKLKQQIPRKIGQKCKHILNTSIKLLFNKYKIHKLSTIMTNVNGQINVSKDSHSLIRKNQIQLIKQLLQCVDKQLTKELLQQQQLLQLIEEDSSFGKYLSCYSSESQYYLLERLLTKSNLTENDVKNIIQTYTFMNNQQVRTNVMDKVVQLLLETKCIAIKQKLVQFVVKAKQFKPQQIQQMIQSQQQLLNKQNPINSQQRLLGKLMLFKQCLLHNDKLYGYTNTQPPFKYLTNNYQIKITIISMVDVLNPMTFQIYQHHYHTLLQTLNKKILPIVGKRLIQVKVKVDKGDNYVRVQELNNRLDQITPYRELSLSIEQSLNNQLSWQDQSVLINTRTNQLNPQIQEILKEVFNHYTEPSQSMRMINKQQQKEIQRSTTNSYCNKTSQQINTKKRLSKESACRIFAIATNVQEISGKDARILHLFNNYSQTGDYLTLTEWLNFYYQSALANPQLVVDNLNNLGYGQVFKSTTNVMSGRKIEQQQSNMDDGDSNRQGAIRNRFRQYFSVNQQLYSNLIQIGDNLIQIGDKLNTKTNQITIQQVNDPITLIRQRVRFIIIELFKQLPKWKLLQQQIIKTFSVSIQNINQNSNQINNSGNNNTSIQSKQYNTQVQSLQRVYLKSIFLHYIVYNYIGNNDKYEQKERMILRTDKVKHYCIQQLHSLYGQLIIGHQMLQTQSLTQRQTQALTQRQTQALTQRQTQALTQRQTQALAQRQTQSQAQSIIQTQRQRQIDPLNLSYRQQLLIWTIQNITNIIVNDEKSNKKSNKADIELFPQIYQMKTLLDKEIAQLKPIESRSNSMKESGFNSINKESGFNSINKLRYNQQHKPTNITNKAKHKQISSCSKHSITGRLSKLCSINTKMVVSYFSLILTSQIITTFQQQQMNMEEQTQQQKVYSSTNNSYQLDVLMSLIYSLQAMFSKQVNLRKLVNKLVFLLGEKMQGLKLYYMIDVLGRVVDNMQDMQDMQNMQEQEQQQQGGITNNEVKNRYKDNDEQSLFQLLQTGQQYFITLNQFIIIETDQQILMKVSNKLIQLISKLLSHPHMVNSKGISQCMQHILNCVKNTLSISRYNDTNNKLNTNKKCNQQYKQLTQICIKLLTQQYFLSPTSQQHLYHILSITNDSNNKNNNNNIKQNNNNIEQNNNLQLIHSMLSSVRLKRNSKCYSTNQQLCGIYNLGCICYINAVFQQLYHIHRFTQYIIKTPIYNHKGISQVSTNQQQQMSQKLHINQPQCHNSNKHTVQPYFKQFQHIFYLLKHSHRQFITTQTFCQSYTDYTGQPINIKQQHDADQFLNQLLDKLQKTYLFNYHIPKHQTIVNKLFQGQMSNIITCQNCYTNKVNQQDFYILSLEIKNLSSLKQCLDKMVQPQIICDYYCTTCNKKVSQIQKYRKFSSLPKILFIHYQRLVFDLQSFTKVKLQNPVLFAEEIDLKDYFYQYHNKACRYRLLGFVVHFGNSQGGHYISLIKSKDSRNKDTKDDKNRDTKGDKNRDTWRKYDDSKISKWFWKTGVHQKDNAYLLIYERVDQQDGDKHKQDNHNKESEMMAEEQSINVQNIHINTSQTTISKEYNQQILEQIKLDNIALNKQLTTTRKQFSKFLINEISNTLSRKNFEKHNQKMSQQQQQQQQDDQDIQQQMLISKILWKYLMLLQQSRSIGVCQTLPVKDSQLQVLTALFINSNKSQYSAQYFLNIAVQQQTIRLLYSVSDKKLRQTLKLILANVLVAWNNQRANKYNSFNVSYNATSSSSLLIPCQQNQTVRKFLLQVQNCLLQVGKSPQKMDQYFQFLYMIISIVPSAREYFKQMNIVAKLVHFMMGKQSKLIAKIGLYYPLNPTGNNKKVSCFNTIIQTIALYIREYPQSIISQQKVSIGQSNKSVSQQNQLYKLSLGQNNFQLYTKLYSQRMDNYIGLNYILSRCCVSNSTLTDRVIDSIITPNINRFNHQDSYIIAYLHLTYTMLQINDSLKTYRIQKVLGIPTIKELNNENVMVKRKHQRIVGYWSNYLTDSDQIIFPLLQLLYTNRQNINYFQIIGIMGLLQIMVQDREIMQYVMKLPSPCLAYQNYLSWIRQFIKNPIRQLTNMRFQKIDDRECLNRIGKNLEELDNMLQVLKQQNSQTNKILQQSVMREQSKQTELISDREDWLLRNSSYLLGQIVEKSPTRLINAKVQLKTNAKVQLKTNEDIKPIEDNLNNEDVINLPLTYTIIKTLDINNWIEYVRDVLTFNPVQQPSQQYIESAIRRAKFEQHIINKHLSNNNTKSYSSLIQLSFSGDNYQLLPFKNTSNNTNTTNTTNTNTALRIQFLHKQYNYNIFISINKLIDSQFKITIPSPHQLNQIINNEQHIQFTSVDKLIESLMLFEIVGANNHKDIKRKQQVQQQVKNRIIQEGNQKQHKQQSRDVQQINRHISNTITLQQQHYPTIDQCYGEGDAYIVQQNQQQTLNNNNNNRYQNSYQNNNNTKKQQVCIQCPFCGYIAHEFASRCPGCNQQWGLYA